MIRVLHLITRLELGGAQRNTLYTVRHLDRRAFAAGLAWGPGGVLDPEADRLDDVDRLVVPALKRPISPRSDWRAVGQIRRAIRAFGPDVLHTHSSKAGILGRVAARLERVSVVVHSVHGWGFTPLQTPMKRWLFRTAERRVAPWTDHFIAVSQANIDQGRTVGLFGDNVSLIRSGIELGRFGRSAGAGALPERWGVPEGAGVVTQIGNFKPQKAPLDFVRMAAELARSDRSVHFIMAGDGPLKPDAVRLAGEAGLESRIHFPGWVEDVPALLAATDVAVLTSRHEGLPRSVVEALASGVPVVATAVDGTPEIVRDGINGFLVPPGSIEDLVDRVRSLLADGHRRRAMGAAGRSGLEEWDIDTMVRKQEELYAWLLCPKT